MSTSKCTTIIEKISYERFIEVVVIKGNTTIQFQLLEFQRWMNI
jgi:hypothetical protein